jgi:hypothetical protein
MIRSTKVRAGALAVGLAATGAVAVWAAAPAQAAAGCQVTYTTNDWTSGPGQGGFTANITVKNLGDAINGWTLRFAFPNGQTLTQGWSATWTQTGTTVAGTNLSWNAQPRHRRQHQHRVQTPTGRAPTAGRRRSPLNRRDLYRVGEHDLVHAAAHHPTALPPLRLPPPHTAAHEPAPGRCRARAARLGNRILTASGTPYRLLG